MLKGLAFVDLSFDVPFGNLRVNLTYCGLSGGLKASLPSGASRYDRSMSTTSDPRLSRRNFGRFFHAIKIPAIAAADGRPSGALTMIVYNVANGRDARRMAPFWRSKRKFWLRRHH